MCKYTRGVVESEERPGQKYSRPRRGLVYRCIPYVHNIEYLYYEFLYACTICIHICINRLQNFQLRCAERVWIRSNRISCKRYRLGLWQRYLLDWRRWRDGKVDRLPRNYKLTRTLPPRMFNRSYTHCTGTYMDRVYACRTRKTFVLQKNKGRCSRVKELHLYIYRRYPVLFMRRARNVTL